jgi:hypothetical protein
MHPRHSPVVAALLAALSLPASAVVTIDWVTVGDTNNQADTAVMTTDGTTGYGSVDHIYRIARKETTIAQYASFLNAVAKTDPYNLYNTRMATNADVAGISRSGGAGSYVYGVIGSGDRPITYVNWFDAARFCNWMHNGQPVGQQTATTTENGVYSLLGALSGVGFTPQAGAMFWIPSEDEWYKAAYYDASKSGGAGGYWLYPTQSDALAGNTIGTAYSANYWDGDRAQDQNGLPWDLTEVGAYGANSASYYGTFDQGGNVYEWTDAVSGSSRGLRGGHWLSSENSLRSSSRANGLPTTENDVRGFRLAGIPEPAASLLVLIGGGLGLTRRHRSAL